MKMEEQIDRQGRQSYKLTFDDKPTVWEMVDALNEIAVDGYGDWDIGVAIGCLVIREHIETEQEAAERRLAEATAELRSERSGRRLKKPKPNPPMESRQCDRRDVHGPHDYQAEFGAYVDTHCPGNDGRRH